MAQTIRWYESPVTGERYRLIEAKKDNPIYTTVEDWRNGVIGDNMNCGIANGAVRKPDVIEAHIGSGIDSVLVQKIGDEVFAVHYVNSANAGRVRDAFDQDEDLGSHLVWLKKPSGSQTYDGRAERAKLGRALKASDSWPSNGRPSQETALPVPLETKTESEPKVRTVKTKIVATKSKTSTKPLKRKNRIQRLGVARRAPLPIITED